MTIIINNEELIKLYKEHQSVVKVGKILQMPQATVWYKLKKLGVMNKPAKCIVSDKILIELYEEHQSIREVGKVLGISHETARYKLKELGLLNIPIRYTWNDDFFSQDNQESFYWAGFIAADGCVKLKNKKYKRLSIGLAIKDVEHLEKFKKAINFTGPIHKYMEVEYPHCEITIASNKMFDDLAKFNIVPRKTLTCTFPESIKDSKYLFDFMRGYFDGDGSFYMKANWKHKPTDQLAFSLRGTHDFLHVYSELLNTHCGFDYKKPRANSGIFMLEYGGNGKVGKIFDILYKDSIHDLRLDRKYELAFNHFTKVESIRLARKNNSVKNLMETR